MAGKVVPSLRVMSGIETFVIVFSFVLFFVPACGLPGGPPELGECRSQSSIGQRSGAASSPCAPLFPVAELVIEITFLIRRVKFDHPSTSNFYQRKNIHFMMTSYAV